MRTCKPTNERHLQVDTLDPFTCKECGVQGEFVRVGKRNAPYRDLPIHGKRVTLRGIRRRHLPGLQVHLQASATGDG